MTKTTNEIARETLAKRGLNHLPTRVQDAVALAVDAVLTALGEHGMLAAARVAPVTPSESDWLLLLMPDSGAHRTREWRGRAVDADAAIERAMDENPGWSVHTFGPDVNAKPAPSPDREKLIAEALDEASVRVDADTYYGDETDAEAAAKAAGFNAAMSIIEPYVQKLAALAVPPVVNEAKLAEIISEHRQILDETAVFEGCDCGRYAGEEEDHHAHVAAVLVERQREWLGTER